MHCHECGKFGHWGDGHNSDESLKIIVKSYTSSDDFIASLDRTNLAASDTNNRSRLQEKPVSFNMAALSVNKSNSKSSVNLRRVNGS